MKSRLRLIAFLLALLMANSGLAVVSIAEAEEPDACTVGCSCDEDDDCQPDDECACFPNPVCLLSGFAGNCTGEVD